jgi:ATP-dependent helicase/nuclease subunit B
MSKHVYTIPPDAAFIDRLAEGLWKQAKRDPFKLSEMLVLLPTRRACRYLHQAFPRIIGKRAVLLPRMQPLGDIDEEELYFADSEDANSGIAPAISPLRRQLLLAQLIRKKDPAMPLDQAAQLALALGQLLDEVQYERLDFAGLEKLVPENYAEHWQKTVEFLKIVTDLWPALLKDEGCIDPALRRNMLTDAQAEAWRKKPPQFPVIAAGSTGTLKATRGLLDVVAGLPQGAVVLPGLDTELDEEAWQAIDDVHPQSSMKHLIEHIGIMRLDVKLWPTCKNEPSLCVRLLNEAMRPAEKTDAWRTLDAKKLPKECCHSLSRITFDTAQEEAQAIALLMRGALEVPERTAALVTGDRALAERVAAQLARWDVMANDSAGCSLAATPVGGFLLDILGAADPDATPIDYLSLLKHPLAACGMEPNECRAKAREVEIQVWRAANENKGETKHIRQWLENFKLIFEPMRQSWRKKLPLVEWIDLHRGMAEQCASDGETGAERIWKNNDGEEAAEWLAEWREAANGFPALSGDEYANLFASLLRAKTIRPAFGQHPRLSILGPLEARLLQADLTILGGMNEGTWPPEPTIDPWMSRPMKHDFELPLPERRIGLSAHDFVQLAAGPKVVITRARRAGNAPTVPSRFLLQLETVLDALGHKNEMLTPKEPWAEWARMLDEPKEPAPMAAPSPKPPVDARPRELRVTDIGTWRRNPYAIYAKYILRLRKLEPIEQEATAADRGNIIHKALEVFLRKYQDNLPADALEDLLTIGRDVFKPYEDEPQAMAFWWPRFENIATWFIEQEQERRGENIKNLQAEAEGSITLQKDFKLKGRADRVDQMPDGTLAIIDYKTGGVPKQKEVNAGLEPQLALLALIASEGGFKDIPAATAAELAYWQLSGGRTAGKTQLVKGSIDTLMQHARQGLENLITQFANANTPYEAVPKPNLAPDYDDYAHLARLAEWGRTAEGA